MRAFDSGFSVRAAGFGLETQRPVFIFGLPRSGSTLVEQVLASHPLVHAAGELGYSDAHVSKRFPRYWAVPAGLLRVFLTLTRRRSGCWPTATIRG